MIPLNLNSYMQQVKDLNKKPIWISFAVEFRIVFIIIGDQPTI
mgnify:FL=1|jgi:hypothetical protein